MRKIMLGIAAASLTIPAVPALALDHNGYYHGSTWRGKDGRLRCRKKNGTVGLIVGGAGGALIGRAIDTRGERTTGTVIGAAAGALIGREVARSKGRRCR